MWRVLAVGILAAAAAGGAYVYNHYDFKPQSDGITIRSRAASKGEEDAADQPPPNRDHKSILIATFNLGPLDSNKVSRQFVLTHLADLIRRFDLVAVQGIHARNKGVLLDLVDKVNAADRHFDFAISSSVGVEPVERYNAFLFDKTTIEVDRAKVNYVDDRQNRFRQKPLVGMFRARGASASEAFTFVLINVHVSPDNVATELNLLKNVLDAVRKSEPAEDDIILLGDLEADETHLGPLSQVPNLTCAVTNTLSTTAGTYLADNLLFDRPATTEFIGRSGVLDVMRVFNLSMQQALEISGHMPVWAEFSVYEGGQPGHLEIDSKSLSP